MWELLKICFKEIKKKDWMSEEIWTKIQKWKKYKNDVKQFQNKKQRT